MSFPFLFCWFNQHGRNFGRILGKKQNTHLIIFIFAQENQIGSEVWMSSTITTVDNWTHLPWDHQPSIAKKKPNNPRKLQQAIPIANYESGSAFDCLLVKVARGSVPVRCGETTQKDSKQHNEPQNLRSTPSGPCDFWN